MAGWAPSHGFLRGGPHKSELGLGAASPEIMSKMRASILVMGPLLAQFKKAEIALPGGCIIGARPIDLHLFGFEKMGAVIDQYKGFLCAQVSTFKESKIVITKSVVSQIKFHHLPSIDPCKISYCKAMGSYTEIYFNNLKKVIVSKRINLIENSINNSNLIRCHKSFLVNLNEIISFSNTPPYLLILRNGLTVKVSLRKRAEILEKMIARQLQ